MSKGRAGTCLLGLNVAAVIGTLWAPVAWAQSESFRFDITNPKMSAALREYARISGEQIIFTEEIVAGIPAARVTGDYTAGAALNQLLNGTDLVPERSPSGAIMIRMVPQSQQPTPPRLVQTEPSQAAAAEESVVAPLRPSASELETVSVSASRIRVDGYEAPTPVTVVDGEAIGREAMIDVGDVIRSLPSFGPSSSPNNGSNQGLVTAGVAGLNLVSLRNLGHNRNLVLFDGQRVVASSIQGGVDLSTLPATLVDRIEVVTGGASAAWGSDAVAGVVNVILDNDFTGLKAHLEAGNNFSGNHAQRKAELSWGTDFADDRGHVVISGSYTDSPDEYLARDIPGMRYQRLVSNPAYTPGNGQPALIRADNVGLIRATPGGIITSGPLAGIHFVGQAATPTAFNYGNVTRGYYTNGGTLNVSEGDMSLMASPSHGSTLFGLASVQLSDSIKASVQLNRGQHWSRSNSWSDIKYGTLVINADNPFTPASVQQQMAALGLASFNLGTMNHDPGKVSLRDQMDSLGGTVIDTDRTLTRGVFNLDGSLGENWSWNAYYQEGRSELAVMGKNNQQTLPYKLAVDAVTVTAANRGSSNLPLGTIVCRSTLTDPGNGCAPLNVFGVGNASPEAIAYITGVARNGGHSLLGTLEQRVAAISMQGVLPFGFAAGDISTATGLEYRKEEGTQRASPAAQASTFQLGNFKNFYGKYDTNEVFVEFNVPLLKQRYVRSLAFDVAGRMTDYSNSGRIETYKLGLTSQIVDALRIRASYSFDIRAPQLFDLFNTGLPVTATAIDPRSGIGVTVHSTSRGNPDLKPEESITSSVGFVFTPNRIRGLSLSLDYYDIDIKGAFATYNLATTIAQCVAGNEMLCDNLVFEGAGGSLSEVFTRPLNADYLTTSGLDLAFDYRTYLGQGAINLSVMANYMFEQTINSLGTQFDYAGSIGQNSPYAGAPQFNGTLAATYRRGGWSSTVQTRIVGPAHLNNGWGALDVDDNDIPGFYYVDLRGSFTTDNGIQYYAALDNVLDKDPPIMPVTADSAAFEIPFQDSIYDSFGRVWRVGVRVKF